eukprot:jgi/Chrzof1/6385/Cz18g08110.t1
MADTESPDTSDYTDTPSATPRLLGDLKTQLRWDLSSSNLHVDVRQILESTRSMEVKYKGCLNTSTGSFEYRGLVRKNFYTNTPSIAKVMAKERDVPMEGADQMDLDRFLPAGVKTLFFRDWSISPGVALTSKPNQKFSYLISLRKQPQVLRRASNLDSWLSAKSNIQFHPTTSDISATTGLRLKAYRFNITDKQDVRLSLGYDLDLNLNGAKGVRSSPYLKLAENNWAVKLRRGSWSFLYEMYR